jgi:hypothetical protein
MAAHGSVAICGVGGALTLDVELANARLIAAAPDLLLAAKDAVETFEIEFPRHPYADQLRAAISKAEGAP